ncbi:phage portal protein family protein, partial [Trichormus variabilis]
MTLPADLKQEIASVERDINYVVYGGTLENPDETLLRRGGGKGLKLYDEIEEDSHAYAVLQKRKLAVIARPWEVKAASDKRLDKKAADLVRAQIETKLDHLTTELLDGTLKGFAVSELMWEDSGSEIFVKEFKARDQRRFTFTPQNELRLLTRQNMVSGEAVPERKFIRHSFGAKDGNPFGRGLGSKLYFPVWFKRQGISFWLVFCEKFGMPTAVGKYGVNASQADQKKLLDALRALAQDAGVIIPEGMEITLLEATRSSTSDLYERLIRYMDEQISETTLGETLTTNIGSVGSKAAADTHDGVRLEVSKADADLLSQTLNNTLCKWTVELNMPGANPPTIWRVFEEQEDLNTRSTRDKTLFDMGFKLKPEAVKEIYGDHYEVVDQGGDGQTSNEDFLKNSGVDAAGQQADAAQQDVNAPGFTELEKVFTLSTEEIAFADWLDGQLNNQNNDADLSQILTYLESLNQLPDVLYKIINSEFIVDNNLSIATYVLIGKRVVELIQSGIRFAEDGRIPIKDPDLLLELKAIIETVYKDGITAIPEVYLDENDNFIGVFEDKINANLTKRLQFKLTESGIEYKLINPGDVTNFSEQEDDVSVDFAARNCKKGISCGASCIAANKVCNQNLAQPQPAAVAKTKTKARALTSTPASPTNTQKTASSTGAKKTKAKASTATPASSTNTQKTAPASTNKLVSTNDAELNTKRQDLVSRFGQKTVADAENNVKRILDDPDTDIYVRVGQSSTLELILGDRFKTSAELGTQTHDIPYLKDQYQTARNRVENKVLGYDENNTKPGDRPIYGYLGGKDMTGASHVDVDKNYGSIAVKLKKDAKDRATFTGSDSFKSGIASEVKNSGSPPPPNAASLVSATRHGYDKDNLPSGYPSFYASKSGDKGQLTAAAKAKNVDDLAAALAPTGNKYVEAQIHGKVTPNDIAEIHFEPRGIGDRPTPAIAKFARDNGVDLYVSGKKLSAKELDNIVTPPKDKRSQKLKDLDDALNKGDFNKVAEISSDIHDQARKQKMAPGEKDAILKQLYAESGYDGKPEVKTKQEMDGLAKAGKVMLNRGILTRGLSGGTQEALKLAEQFRTGDYFVGNGVYGNGTYVGHSGKFSKDGSTFIAQSDAKSQKRAWQDVAKNNYIQADGATLRMALKDDAVVMT